MKVRSKGVLFSLVLAVMGFFLTLSIDFGSSMSASKEVNNTDVALEDQLREQLAREQETTSTLSQQLQQTQSEVSEIEEEVASRQHEYEEMVTEIEKLRMITGAVPVEGEGISIQLYDAEYIPEEENPNAYIVHEKHIQKVIDELKVSGAEAIAVNGRRIGTHSYIRCVGPVIEIDGYTSYAPFEITAIGDGGLLEEAINMAGGVTDQLLSENIEVRIDKRDDIVLDSLYDDRGE